MTNSTRTTLMVVVIIVMALLALLLMWGGTMMGGMMYPRIAWDGSLPWWRGLLTIAFSASLIAGIGLVIEWLLRRSDPGEDSSRLNPIDILKERYARGEIGREQYVRMRHDLE